MLRGAAEIVTGIDNAEGRFALILEAAGGASLAAAIARVEAKGTIVIFGNSSGEPTAINFRDFAEHQNARIQAFRISPRRPKNASRPDLALLAALVADGSLRPGWSKAAGAISPGSAPNCATGGSPGKAVFRVEHG